MEGQDITGMRFGRLIAINKTNRKNSFNHRFWDCICDCGEHTLVPASILRSGNTRSCGCLQQALRREYALTLSKMQRHRLEQRRDKEGIQWYANTFGYRTCKWQGHPIASKKGRLLEHWFNFYVAHGEADWVIKAKKDGATLHHRDGVRHHNDPTNLELRWPGTHPRGWTTEVMIEVLERQGYVVINPATEGDKK